MKYRDEIEINNKAEVAMGLVDAKELIKKQQEVDSDICGETGVKYIMMMVRLKSSRQKMSLRVSTLQMR